MLEMDKQFEVQYPKAKYHAELPVRVVMNEEEDAELPEGWFDNPNEVVKREEKRGPGRPKKVAE